MKPFQYLLNTQRLFITFLQSLRISVQFVRFIMYFKYMSVGNKFIIADIHTNLRVYQKVWWKTKYCLWMFLVWFPQEKDLQWKIRSLCRAYHVWQKGGIIRLTSVVQTGVIFPSNFLQYLISPLLKYNWWFRNELQRKVALVSIKSWRQYHSRPFTMPFPFFLLWYIENICCCGRHSVQAYFIC